MDTPEQLVKVTSVEQLLKILEEEGFDLTTLPSSEGPVIRLRGSSGTVYSIRRKILEAANLL